MAGSIKPTLAAKIIRSPAEAEQELEKLPQGAIWALEHRKLKGPISTLASADGQPGVALPQCWTRCTSAARLSTSSTSVAADAEVQATASTAIEVSATRPTFSGWTRSNSTELHGRSPSANLFSYGAKREHTEHSARADTQLPHAYAYACSYPCPFSRACSHAGSHA